MKRAFGLSCAMVGSVIALVACTGGPGPLPGEQTDTSGSGATSDERPPSSAEPGRGSGERPSGDDNGQGADDERGPNDDDREPNDDDAEARDGG